MRSPTRRFAILSLVTIGASTLLLGLALDHFVEQGLLDHEWNSTAALVRASVVSHLRPGDFGPRRGPPAAESGERLEEFSRQVRMLPGILRLVAWDTQGRAFWSDTERELAPHEASPPLARALAGVVDAHLQPGTARGAERVELYVPVSFPGEGRVAGVLEAYVDASRVIASIRRARMALWSLAVVSGAWLYAALYGIVWRASRELRAQHRALEQHAAELATANAELRRVQQQLVTAERFAAFGEITAAVAHGLGNPLASIRATAQLALLDLPEGALRDQVLRIVTATDRLRERMRALLDFGRTVEQRRVPTALDQAVAQAVEPVRARAAGRGVRVEVAIPADLPKLRLDPARFEEALLCLLTNALDAMPGGGLLRVEAASRPLAEASALAEPTGPGRPELTVSDTGPGIPATALARVFEPFYTTKPTGTGLGLPVAKKLLEGMGARLRLESGAGGTRAIVSLPWDEA